MNPFVSFAGSSIQDHLILRQRLGYTDARHRNTTLQAFDRYLQTRGITFFQEVNTQLVSDFIRAPSGQCAATKNLRLKYIRILVRYWLRVGLLEQDPTVSIPFLPEERRKPYIYTLQELGRLLQIAETWKHRRAYRFSGWTAQTLFYLIYSCGLRVGEAVNLKIKDVDFDDNSLSLWKTKFHKERLVPFSLETAAKLKVYAAVRNARFPVRTPRDFFFRHARGPYTTSMAQWLFRRLLSEAGMAAHKPRPRIHDLRHSFAVHRLYQWYQEGYDLLNRLPLLSTYLGHYVGCCWC